MPNASRPAVVPLLAAALLLYALVALVVAHRWISGSRRRPSRVGSAPAPRASRGQCRRW